MRQMIKILIFTLAFVLAAHGQTGAKALLSPTAADLSEAKRQGFEVFKILPRGTLDYEENELRLRGGGAYYSFVNKSHSYDAVPQIELQKNDLSVGFYGANYGFIADLGETPLSALSAENKYAGFLLSYRPKKYELEAREEYRTINRGFAAGELKFHRRAAAKVGHTYILRAISYSEADTLVAFQIHRREADGSLVIFWKLLENFEKPLLAENK